MLTYTKNFKHVHTINFAVGKHQSLIKLFSEHVSIIYLFIDISILK